MAVEDARIREMLKGRRAVRRVPVPAMWHQEDAEMGVRVLLSHEVDDARMDATQYVQAMAKSRKVDPVLLMTIDAEMHDAERERAIIYRAFVKLDGKEDSPNPTPFFQGPAEVRQLDTVMVRTLFDMYLDHQQHVNPLHPELSEAQAQELADAMGKGPEESEEILRLLSLFDAPTLRRFVRSLASQLATSQTGK